MALHLRLLQVEMYLPSVTNTTELQKALSPLKRFCKEQHNVALAIEPFSTDDRGQLSLLVAGVERRAVEQESEHLLLWLESHINGQSLATEVSWL